MVFVTNEHLPKTMKDESGVECEVIGILASEPVSPQGWFDPANAGRVVVLLGDPVRRDDS